MLLIEMANGYEEVFKAGEKLMKNFFKRLFCSHEYLLARWHWCHGPNGNDPRMIESEWRCQKCGKLYYIHPTRGSKLEAWMVRYGG